MEFAAGALEGAFYGTVQIPRFKGMLGVMVSLLKLVGDGLIGAKKLLHHVIGSTVRSGNVDRDSL